jgi:hypothetical protein
VDWITWYNTLGIPVLLVLVAWGLSWWSGRKYPVDHQQDMPREDRQAPPRTATVTNERIIMTAQKINTLAVWAVFAGIVAPAVAVVTGSQNLWLIPISLGCVAAGVVLHLLGRRHLEKLSA